MMHATRFRPTLPAGLPVSVTPLNPISFLLKAASINPHKVALSHPETHRSWTYQQWAIRVCNLVNALRSRGVKSGDKVFLLMPNTPAMADAIQACTAMGAILVPINIRLLPQEVEYLVMDSGASFGIVDYEFAHLCQNINIPRVVSSDGAPGCEYESFLAEGAASDRAGLEWAGIELGADEHTTIAICYTSGTTSKPKGVETTPRGTYLAATNVALEHGLTSDSVYLWILPMFHCVGWCYPYAVTLAMGKQVCMRAVGNYDQVWRLLKGGVTHYSGAPTVQLSIASHPNRQRLNHAVSTSVAGAAPTPQLISDLEGGLGIFVSHWYGLTETYGPFAMNRQPIGTAGERKARLDSSFVHSDDLRVFKTIPEGQELTTKTLEEVLCDGETVGEICLRGNITMKGYYKDPVATAKAFAGGWFHTGDLAVRFPDGSFKIADRSKDIIISGGENVSSIMVEQRLTAHPDIYEVAVIGRKSEQWGERVHAVIVLTPESLYAGKEAELFIEVAQFSRGVLPGFARPASIEIVEALEKTSTGKVSKKTLRELLNARDAQATASKAKL